MTIKIKHLRDFLEAVKEYLEFRGNEGMDMEECKYYLKVIDALKKLEEDDAVYN